MKRDEIEIIDFESEVEVLGVANIEGSMLENEGAFIVDVDDMDMPQDDDVF